MRSNVENHDKFILMHISKAECQQLRLFKMPPNSPSSLYTQLIATYQSILYHLHLVHTPGPVGSQFSKPRLSA